DLERTESMQAEAAEAKSAVAGMEAAAQAVEDGNSAVARELEVDTSRLGLLRDVLFGERRSKDRALATLDDSRKRLRAVLEGGDLAVAVLETDLILKCKDSESLVLVPPAEIKALQGSLAELEMQDGRLLADLATTRGQRTEVEVKLNAARNVLDGLTKQVDVDSASSRQRRDVVLHMQTLLKDHSDASCSALAELRGHVREEQQRLGAELEGKVLPWIKAFEQDGRLSASRRRQLQEAADSAEKAAALLEDRLSQRAAASQELAPQAASLNQALTARRVGAEERRATAQLASFNASRVVAALGTSLPTGMPETARRLLQQFGGDGAVSTQEAPGDLMAALEVELRDAVGSAEGAAAEEERRRSAAQEARSRSKADAESASWRAEAAERRAIVGAQVAELSSELATFAVEGGDAEDASGALVHKSEEKLAAFGRRLAAAEALGRSATQRSGMAEAELTAHATAVSAATETAQLDTQRPLEAALAEALKGLDSLRRRLPAEFADLEARCAERTRSREHSLAAELEAKEAELRQSLGAQRADASSQRTAKASDLAAVSCAGERLQKELDTRGIELEVATKQLRHLEERRTASEQGVQKERDALWQVERRLTDAAESRRREARKAQEEESDLTRQHSEVATQLKLRCKDEFARLQAQAGTAASSLVAEFGADVEDALQTHAELEGKSARLVARAKGQLAAAAKEGGAAMQGLAANGLHAKFVPMLKPEAWPTGAAVSALRNHCEAF
ncbi:unnamed protein product, partial [Polarella glacialis]